MSMTWGPGLDAELSYRREQVAGAAARRGLAGVRSRRHAEAASAAPRTSTARQAAPTPEVGEATGARAA